VANSTLFHFLYGIFILFYLMLVRKLLDMTLHYFAWGLQSECGLGVVWKPACSESEMMSFGFRLKSVEELYHSTPMGFDCVGTISQLPTRKIPI
jgi:hypothetical protein